MPYTVSNQEQLRLLGREILHDILLTEHQSKIHFRLIKIGGSLTKLFDSSEKDIETFVKESMEEFINIKQCDDDDKKILLEALSAYITEQMFIIPKLLHDVKKFLPYKLDNYYRHSGQEWFITYGIPGKGYNGSLNLDIAIKNIIEQLLTINNLIYTRIPTVTDITELLDKLRRMLITSDCDAKTPYNEEQMIISRLIPILEAMKARYLKLKNHAIKYYKNILEIPNIENILGIPNLAATINTLVPEYRRILGVKLPITTKELDFIFSPISKAIELDSFAMNYWLRDENFKHRIESRYQLHSGVPIEQLLLVKSDLTRLLENCVAVKCNFSGSELSTGLLDLMKENGKLEAYLNAYFEEYLLLIDFNKRQQLFDRYFNQPKVLLAQKQELTLLEEQEYRKRDDLYSKYEDDLCHIMFKFNAEKTIVVQQIKKEQLLKKLINNPATLYGVTKSIDGKNQQIINFDFVSKDGKQRLLQLTECQCEQKFQRNPLLATKDYRSLMESNIIKSILDNVKDISEQINLACVGSDWFGLTIILAKLYKYGYKNFNVINIEKSTKDQELLNTYVKLSKDCQRFWEWLFSNSQNTSQVKINVRTVTQVPSVCVGMQKEQGKKLFLFAEDLGHIRFEQEYSGIVTNLARDIFNNHSELEIFFTTFNADVQQFKKANSFTLCQGNLSLNCKLKY